MNIDSIYKELAQKIDNDRLIKDAAMKEYTSFKAGGNAALLAMPENIEQLSFALKILASTDIDYFIMGNGTNLLVRDRGYNGVIIRIADPFSNIKVSGDSLIAESGALLSSVANKACEHGLAGFEFASGIPGSLGGATFMNAGAYDGDMSKVVESVQVISKDGSKEYTLTNEEMQFGYRKSILMTRGDIVASVKIKLSYGDKKTISAKIEELAKKRNEKQPLQYPSAGSFFKRPVGNYAGKLIQDANLKGLTVGGAKVSTLHAGFIINEGNASATDIIDLMKLVQNIVYENSGIMLEPEVRII
ncbi:MAG: UDP-N-acetylmuramate dehydrogenase [Clostridiales bacterium]|nr:UDP-N-acetylmuramate dehydrogenase [Clostridiales bacterium]